MEKFDFNFQLPDRNLSDSDYDQEIENLWAICDRIDQQTDLLRGQILKSFRDREKLSCDQTLSRFRKFLKNKKISKSKAYDVNYSDPPTAEVGASDFTDSCIRSHKSLSEFREAFS